MGAPDSDLGTLSASLQSDLWRERIYWEPREMVICIKSENVHVTTIQKILLIIAGLALNKVSFQNLLEVWTRWDNCLAWPHPKKFIQSQ